MMRFANAEDSKAYWASNKSKLDEQYRTYTCGAVGGTIAHALGLSQEWVALLCGYMAANRDSPLVGAVQGLLGYIGAQMLIK